MDINYMKGRYIWSYIACKNRAILYHKFALFKAGMLAITIVN